MAATALRKLGLPKGPFLSTPENPSLLSPTICCQPSRPLPLFASSPSPPASPNRCHPLQFVPSAVFWCPQCPLRVTDLAVHSGSRLYDKDARKWQAAPGKELSALLRMSTCNGTCQGGLTEPNPQMKTRCHTRGFKNAEKRVGRRGILQLSGRGEAKGQGRAEGEGSAGPQDRDDPGGECHLHTEGLEEVDEPSPGIEGLGGPSCHEL